MNKYLVIAASVLALSASMPAFADDNVNTSWVDQIGSNISATVKQGGDDDMTNVSDIDQGLSSPGAHHLTANVTQTGDETNNYANVKQNGQNNKTTVLQNGTDNLSKSWTDQVGTGSLNTITVAQGGGSATNTSTVNQNGSALTASVTQN